MSPNQAALELLNTLQAKGGHVNVWTWFEPGLGVRLRVTASPDELAAVKRSVPSEYGGYVVIVEPSDQAFGSRRRH